MIIWLHIDRLTFLSSSGHVGFGHFVTRWQTWQYICNDFWSVITSCHRPRNHLIEAMYFVAHDDVINWSNNRTRFASLQSSRGYIFDFRFGNSPIRVESDFCSITWWLVGWCWCFATACCWVAFALLLFLCNFCFVFFCFVSCWFDFGFAWLALLWFCFASFWFYFDFDFGFCFCFFLFVFVLLRSVLLCFVCFVLFCFVSFCFALVFLLFYSFCFLIFIFYYFAL